MDTNINQGSGRTEFVILYQGRAGSSFLVDALDRHQDITVRGEILRWLAKPVRVPKGQGGYWRNFLASFGYFLRLSPGKKQADFAAKFLSDSTIDSAAIGFKTKVRDLRNPAMMKALFEKRGVRIIVLNRRNHVKKAVAHIYGKRLYEKTQGKFGSKAWNLFDESDRLSAQYIDCSEFDLALKRVVMLDHELQDFVGQLKVPLLTLEYEDLLRDREAWFLSIFNFLGVQNKQLDSSVLQNEPDDLRSALLNFDEIKAYYDGSEYAKYFSESEA